MVRIFVFYLILLFGQIIIYPQSSEQINDDFTRGVTLFNQANYAEANRLFESIINYTELHSKTSAAYIFSAKCLLEMQRYSEAEKTISGFLDNFKPSIYYEDGLLLASKIYFDNLKYFNSADFLLQAIEKNKSSFVKEELKTNITNLSLNFLTSSEVERFEQKYSNNELTPFILYVKGLVLTKEGSLQEAENTFFEIIRNYPESAEHSKSSDLYAKLKNLPPPTETKTNIGVILPLSYDRFGNPTNSAAQEVLEGIKYAIHEYNQNNFSKVGLLIRDTQRNQENIKQINNEFRGIRNIVAVVGPLFSDEVKIAAETFRSTDIPLISPTATDNDLHGINNYFFQANPSFDMRGRVMAQYLIFVENKRNIAVFNRENGYSALLAESFIDEFQKFGGTVIAHQTYPSSVDDISSYASSINTVRSRIDGIYIPISERSDARKVLSSLSNFQFNVSLYGNQDWFNVQGLEHFPNITDKLTFTSDYFIDFNSPDIRDLGNRFRKTTGMEVNRNMLYGYDSAKMLVELLSSGNITRDKVHREFLSGLRSNGYHNNIYFDDRKVNSYLNIVRYRNGVFELIDRFNASK